MIIISSTEQAINGIIDGMEFYIEEKLNKASFDKTERAIIISINNDNTYNISMNGAFYEKIKASSGSCYLNEIVRVRVPKNNYNNIYIEKGNTSSSEGSVYSVNGQTGDITVVEDKTYIYIQSTAIETWNVNHNLNKYPNINIVDSSGIVVFGEITYVDSNNLTLSFSIPFSGKAYLN